MSKHPNPPPAGVCRIVVTLGLLLCAGCASPFGIPENDLVGPSLQRLHEIQTVDLESHSGDEPLTVEQAADEAIEELLKRSMIAASTQVAIPGRRMPAPIRQTPAPAKSQFVQWVAALNPSDRARLRPTP